MFYKQDSNMKGYWRHLDEINRLFNTPQHKHLKYAALIVIGVVIAAQIAIIIWDDDISNRIKSFIQGCVGLGAIVFVILVTILTYTVFSEYFRSKYDNTEGKK